MAARKHKRKLECHLLPRDHRCADYCYSCSTTVDGGANEREPDAYHYFQTIESGYRALALDGNIDAFYHSCYILSDAMGLFAANPMEWICPAVATNGSVKNRERYGPKRHHRTSMRESTAVSSHERLGQIERRTY
jgi:hypothetical protein